MQALSTTSGCLLVLIIFYICELLYGLLSTSTSFILFKPLDNACMNITYPFHRSWNGPLERYYSNDDKNNNNYLPLLLSWLAQCNRVQKWQVWGSDSNLMPNPEFEILPSSKDGSLQHDHSMISPAVAEQKGLQHQLGIWLVWLLKWLNICH